MVLYIDEFEKEYPTKGKHMRFYDKLPEYLHEMKPEKITEYASRNGRTSMVIQSEAILAYLSWLAKYHGAEAGKELPELNYDLTQKFQETECDYIGFYNLAELRQTLEEHIRKIEAISPRADLSGYVIACLMEWYGITTEEFVSVRMQDVSEDGREIYVPKSGRTAEIDDTMTASAIAEYRRKAIDSGKTQECLYITSKDIPLKVKTIYNARDKFMTFTGDDRFAKRRVYYSGRFAKMFEMENEHGTAFLTENKNTQKIMSELFGELSLPKMNYLLSLYRSYKTGYLKSLN